MSVSGGASLVPASKPASQARMSGEGLVARFKPIKGVTPKGALDRSIYLPAMLDTFTVDETAQHNEYDTLSGGHFSQPAMGNQNARQLRTTTPNAIIVDFDAPWLVATGQDPQEIRRRLSEILRFKKAVHMMVFFHPSRHQISSELDMYCTFRDISTDVRNGELETRYLTITISEWRDPVVHRRSSSTSRKHGISLPTTHKLTATDTLSSLSFEYYGSYAFWREIRDANSISKRFGAHTKLVTLPGRWKVGYKVKIPNVQVGLTPRPALLGLSGVQSSG
jgi:nucleoid-associated protein YgaU